MMMVNNFAFLQLLMFFWCLKTTKPFLNGNFLDQQYLIVIKFYLYEFSGNLPVVMGNNFYILQYFVWALFVAKGHKAFKWSF